MRNNMEIDKLTEGADIVRFIKAQRIKWLGHIQTMDRARPTRKLLDGKPVGNRPVGRPRQRWQEDVMEDFKKLKIKNRKETAKDRRNWRDLAERAKTHKGFDPSAVTTGFVADNEALLQILHSSTVDNT